MKTNLTKLDRSKIVLPNNIKDILIGIMLGDGCAQKPVNRVNVRLTFEQGIVHKDYLEHLYELFRDFCPSSPKIRTRAPNKRTGKVHSSIRFQTRCLPCFNELFDIFYPLGKKTVPANIGDLLTPLGLAFWISDDGDLHKRDRCVTLNTQGFTLSDVNLLAKTLNDKWDLQCTINKNREYFVIRIPRKSLPILQSLLKDIMPPMMRHKIGL